MKSCDQIHEYILELFMGSLSDQKKQLVRDHIDSCSACKDYHKHLFRQMDVIERISECINHDMVDREERAVKALQKLPPSASPHVTTWRTIMHRKITKIAIAAMIVIAACLIIYQYGGTVGFTAVTFAQVQQAMNEVSWLHMIFIGEGRDEHDISEIWAGFESGVYASKLLDDYARFVDLNEGKEYNYDPEAKTIVISAVEKEHFEYDLGSPWTLMQSMIGNLTDEGANVQYTTGKYNGQRISLLLLTHEQEDGSCKCRIFVDTQTHLILGGRTTWEGKYDNEVINTEVTVKYPESGPTSIYDFGIPRSTDILDHADK